MVFVRECVLRGSGVARICLTENRCADVAGISALRSLNINIYYLIGG